MKQNAWRTKNRHNSLKFDPMDFETFDDFEATAKKAMLKFDPMDFETASLRRQRLVLMGVKI